MNSCERLLNEFHGTTFRDSDEIAKTFYVAGLRRARDLLLERHDVQSNKQCSIDVVMISAEADGIEGKK